MPIEPHDVVYLIATGAPMTVEMVDDERAVCTFPEYSSKPVPEGSEREVICKRRDVFPLDALRPDSRKFPCDRCDGSLRGQHFDMYRCENEHERTGKEVVMMAFEWLGVRVQKIEVQIEDPDRLAFGLVEAFRDR